MHMYSLFCTQSLSVWLLEKLPTVKPQKKNSIIIIEKSTVQELTWSCKLNSDLCKVIKNPRVLLYAPLSWDTCSPFWWNLPALMQVPVLRETEKSFPTQDKNNNCIIYSLYSKGYMYLLVTNKAQWLLCESRSIFSMVILLVLWMYNGVTMFIWWPMDL